MAQQEYQIQYGDTLSGIGARFGVSYQDLAAWNNISNPNMIYAGNTIKLFNPTAAPAQPQTPAQVGTFLNQQQQNEFVNQNTLTNPYAETTPKTDQQIKDEINGAITPTTPLPTAPNLEQTFQDQRQAMGLDQLESELTNLKSQQQQIEAMRRLRVGNERNQRVGMGVISGRTTEIDQQTQEDMDFIGRQIDYKTNQVQAAYSTINTIINLKNTDFGNALQLYNTELDKNMKTYELFREEKNTLYDRAQKEIERQQDISMANLQIYMNLVKDGNLFWNNLDQDTKLAISKLEVQSGLGIGFLQKIGMDPDKQKQLIGKRVDNSGNDIVDYMVTDPSGNRRIESVILGKNADYALQQQSLGLRAAELQVSKENAKNSAALKEQQAGLDAQNAFYKDAQSGVDNLYKGYNWATVWNTLRAKYPGISNADIDRALGVPDSWIKAGKPGYDWWYEQTKTK